MRLLLLSFFMIGASAATIQFRDGTTKTGELGNASLTVQAPYGPVPIPADELARIHFGSGVELDTVITRSAQRVSGFVNDPLSLGDAILPKSDLAEIDLAPISPAADRSVVLWNGDLLAGSFALTNFPTEGLHSIWFERNSTEVRLQTISGLERSSELVLAGLPMTTSFGAEVRIPRGLLKVIYLEPGTVPPERHRLTRGARGSGSSPDHAPPGMVWIPPGQVLVGSPLDERGRNSDEGPQTEVAITRGFWLGQHEVTQGEYAAIMGQNPSTFQGDTNRPVEKVSWHDAVEYCARLIQRAQAEGTLPSGYVYRLPTEAEWEYACRAGSTAPYSFGDDPAERELPRHAWFAANSGWTTHPVGQLEPNAFGLHDMHGNVLEWCLGLWNDTYPGGRVDNYNGPDRGWLRVARGGSWLYGPEFARSANRDDYGPGNRCSDLGFRVALAPKL